MKMMMPRPTVVMDLPMVRVDKQKLQKGSLNDPALQDGVLYFNAAHTSYLYLDGYDLYWYSEGAAPVKLN